MSVGSISGTGQTSAAWQAQRQNGSQHSTMRKGLDAAAKALGMSTDDLKSALTGGQTMSDLAKSKGVSTSDLTSAISNALSSADTSLSGDKAKEIAGHMVSGMSGGPGGAGGAGGSPPAGGGFSRKQADSALDAVANALGTTTDNLKTSLQPGSGLTSVWEKSGKTDDQLKTTITDALQKADPSLSADDASKEAQQIMDGPPKQPDMSRMGFSNKVQDSSSSWSGSGGALTSTTSVQLQYASIQAMLSNSDNSGSGWGVNL